jgi:glucosamine-6-phosphate deaminase
MRIILSESKNEAIQTITTIIMERITSRPASVIGLATGRTMEPVYAEWISKGGDLNYEKCFFFMLDEYLGLKTDHPSSFSSYIKKHLAGPLNLKDSQIAYPPIHLPPAEAGAHYERLLKEAGGIDIQLLGIGVNGHVGFNEPGSNKDSRTRLVKLSAETLAANQDQFPDQMVPKEALSMGIATIMESRQLLMLATGESKAQAIKYLLNHHDDEKCPATMLKSHPHFVLVLDPAAASKISLKI